LQPFTLSIGSNDDGVFLRAVGKRAQCRDEAPQRRCNATRETRFNVDVDSDLQDFLSGCSRAHRRCVFKYASWRNGNTAYWGRRTEFKRLRGKKGSYHCSWRPPLSISSRIGKPFVFCARFSRTTTREPFGYHACTRERRSLPLPHGGVQASTSSKESHRTHRTKNVSARRIKVSRQMTAL
jgi:hypothetical protein